MVVGVWMWDDSTSSETLRSGDAELVSGRTIWHDCETPRD